MQKQKKITETEKKALKNRIKKLIREAIEENYYFEKSEPNRKTTDEKNSNKKRIRTYKILC